MIFFFPFIKVFINKSSRNIEKNLHTRGIAMELHQLEYVLAVAKYQGFTRAAEEIKVSQPSLSQQISKLESELGISIFVRTTRSVRLTQAGAEFAAHAERIMAEIKRAEQSIKKYLSVEKGQLSIGAIPIIGHYRIPNLLASFQSKFPDIKINIIEEQCELLLGMIHSAKIDAAILSQNNFDSMLNYYPLETDHMVVVINKDHPFSHKDYLELRELKTEKFITAPNTSGNYQDLLRACKSNGFVPKVLVNCHSVNTILGLVQEGLGIAVLSSRGAEQNYKAGLVLVPLIPPIERPLYLAVQKNNEHNYQLRIFLKFALEWIDSNNIHAKTSAL
ncbi:LysR family transcriptional regulator [Candidatus Contubernalis alkaliaceticus]|uniref:LysR family transcriptional regulator n=1 Tax=Candidatus Contubernalis alkaliaceticus TaxID=338645 RepID=UPI001F4C299E|nr:LysR family transcriptional regulator [Candidatus Contubernalis alkalaceticus]UNC91549.1 LysR family transcriptional regulator [Candidatus Contubernalis alkalaceticus]